MKYLPKLVKIVRQDVIKEMETGDVLFKVFFRIDRFTHSTTRAIAQQAILSEGER